MQFLRRASNPECETSRGLLRSLHRNTEGATAIEFAMVATPFLMMLFGIIGVGLFFFTTFSLENAVEQAARVIRTGQAQTGGMTAATFKTHLCTFVPRHIDCTGKLKVNVKSYADSASIPDNEMADCLTAGGALNSVTEYVPGNANAVVLVWVCYEYELRLPWLQLSNMPNGSQLIKAATTFRTEPYTN